MQLGGPKRDDETPQSGAAAAAPTAATAPGGEPRGDLVGAPRPAAPPVGQDDVTKTAASVEADGALSHGDERRPAPLQFRDPDRYEIIAEHGRGGLGRVLRARDKEMGRDVALKEMLRRGHTAEARFFREALITARLEHPGIVPVHEAGRWPDGTPFYAMKLVAGRPLSEFIDEAKTLEQRLALLPHVIAVADAIAYAHERRIIHRDLKPSNVIVGEFGETVVIDWGLAKQLDEDDEPSADGPYRTPVKDGLTVAGSVLGTPAYMAPEQAAGGQVDQRADVYALGLMLLELCTGPGTLSSHLSQLETTLNRSKIDPDLIAIMMKALTPSRADRYGSAGALATDLRAFVSGSRVGAREYSLLGLLGHWIRHNRRSAIALAVVALIGGTASVASVKAIATQRDRARAALLAEREAKKMADDMRVAAEKERDRTRLRHAAEVLQRDPTAAIAILNVAAPDVRESVVLARARGQGVATRVLEFPGPIGAAVSDGSGKRVALVGADQKLYLVDVPTGETRVIAQGLNDPPQLVRVGGDWVFSHVDGDRFGISALDDSGLLRRLAVTESPPQLLPNSPGFLVDGALHDLHAPTKMLWSDVSNAVLQDDDWLICSRDGVLSSLTGPNRRRLGHCVPGGLIRRSGSLTVLPAAPGVLGLRSPDRTTSIATQSVAFVHLAVSESGLITWVDQLGVPWFLDSSASVPQRGSSNSIAATSTAAAVGLVAWGYEDGALAVHDVVSGRSWAFKGHMRAVTQVFMDTQRGTVLSVGGGELREWSLSQPAMTWPKVSFPCAPSNLSISADLSNISVDCTDGQVLAMPMDDERIAAFRQVHRHSNVAYGLAWRTATEVCSVGWDGKVLCTDVKENTSSTVASVRHAVRAISADRSGRLAAAVASGEVWMFDPSPRVVARHEAEAVRVAFDETGSWLASGARDGAVLVSHTERDGPPSLLHRHNDRVAALSWDGDRLTSLSADGELVTIDPNSATLLSSQQLEGRFGRLLARGGRTVVGSRQGGLTWMGAGRVVHLELDSEILDIDMSTRGDRVLASTARGEIAILDVSNPARPRVAIQRVSFTRVVDAVIVRDVVVAIDDASLYLLKQEQLEFVEALMQ